MGPKRHLSATASESAKKKVRKSLSLEQKLKILDELKSGKRMAEMARLYNINESSVRAIKSREKAIRDAIKSSVPMTSKVTSHVRDNTLVKTEKALNIWLEDMNKRRVPIDGPVLRTKALSLYEHFYDGSSEEAAEHFKASKGWLHSFRNRFNLHNIKLSGEVASADKEAADKFPEHLKTIIDEKGYLPEQVFNSDETGLFWKMMPSRTYISKREKQAPGFKAAKDRVTVIVCGNAAGHLIKPGLLYKAKNPRALKGKNKHLLPVYWQSNKKAWVTANLFIDWFHQCFIPEVERYLHSKNIEFKVMLIIDNAPGHSQALNFAHDKVEVVFLPPNTTPLIQPMDKGVIKTFKAHYTRITFQRIRNAMDQDPNLDLIQCWKSYTIADCISNIEQAMSEVKESTVNACWGDLWRDATHDFKGFPTVDTEIAKIVQLAREFSGEGFADMQADDIDDLLEQHDGQLSTEDLEELAKSAEEEESTSDEEAEQTIGWNLHRFAEIFRLSGQLKEKILEYDTSLEKSLKITRGIDLLLAPYTEMYKEMQRKKKQLPITMFFEKKQAQRPQEISPQPSTSSSSQVFMDVDDPPVADNDEDLPSPVSDDPLQEEDLHPLLD